MEIENRLQRLETYISDLESSIGRTHGRNLQLGSYGNYTQEWTLNSGDTAWMLTSTALVLLMTIPGLAIYYGGMVRVQNVLSTAMQSLSITCLITFLWLCVGYSISFAPVDLIRDHAFIGDSSRMWLQGLTVDSAHMLLASTIPESVYCTFQLTFAIITPALICGSFADRMKYESMMVFMTLWHVFVYCPIAHCNWHPEGFLFKKGVLDFAGGNVVHIASGMAGLMSTIVIGNRQGFGVDRFEPHNILLTFMGASMLWVGWFGFNAGSAGSASPRAGMAMITTQISTSVSALTWMMTECIVRKQPSVLGMVSGCVAGLVAITPACGYVDPTGAFIIGLVAGPWCYAGAQIKHYLGYDDALDAFGVHATGGILGGLMTGLFARAHICGVNGAFYGNAHQLIYQIYGVLFAVGYSGCISYLLLKAVDLTMGLRVDPKHEIEGLDSSVHGESVMGASAHGLDKSMNGNVSLGGSPKPQVTVVQGVGVPGSSLA